MTGSTKILTVSYGTFSCTLEGFDDPFGTMRGIAEYFRDLAADDRYFGAEPPTPDVEMLQRIAEKEVQRRVEARIGEAGVALTQLTDGGADDAPEAPTAETDRPAERVMEDHEPARERAEPVAAADEDDDDDFDSGPLTHDDEYLLSDEPEDVLAVDPSATPPADGPAETVAEKLRRIRAVVSRSIEPDNDKDGAPFSEAQASGAEADDAQPRRDRAYTRTIEQITEDLADDEDAPVEAIGDENFGASDEDADTEDEIDSVEAAGGSGDGWDFDTEGLAPSKAEDEDYDDDEDDFENDDSDVLGKVLSKTRAEDDSAAPKPVDKESPLVLEAGEADDTPPRERRVSRPLTPIADEGEDVGRILAETDNHLNDDESVRRRRVISQMRAAVAATKADRLVSRRVSTSQDDEAFAENAYRSDLSEAVRQVSRPMSEAKDKGNDRRPSVAPLVLVSSQRVDDSNGPAKEQADAPQDFAGFAKSMGAKELPDLLEAAAAYTSFVEGQASFSRPEIMKRVARVDPSLHLSREDGLRSFGQLLRQGKLRKLERGQFTIAETTRFKPEQRIAG
ncbi:MAG: hypothetical protein KJO42_10460, partial [Silicimonas sp.]|nr:hypothetical protein [Silicimonas sp.]